MPNDRQQPGQDNAAAPNANTVSTKDVLNALFQTADHTQKLQGEVQTIYKSLPVLLNVATQVAAKKHEGDQAMAQTLQRASHILEEARQKSAQLAQAYQAQENVLVRVLTDQDALFGLLKVPDNTAQTKVTPTAHPQQNTGFTPNPGDPDHVASAMNTLMTQLRTDLEKSIEQKIANALNTAQKQADQ